MPVELVWITPSADHLVAYLARVSNPDAKPDGPSQKLISYLIRNRHWSPFEMASICFEIETTRDVSRQLLRHRSFSFQEFSQRYASVDKLPEAPLREARLQDPKNRQNSLPNYDDSLEQGWRNMQTAVRSDALSAYHWALQQGIAKEVARALLPEGLTTTRMYMSGTVRSWLHLLDVRLHPGTQKETQDLMADVTAILHRELPMTMTAFTQEKR